MLDAAALLRRAATSAAVLALCGASVPATQHATPNADAIFSRARDAASSQHCPQRLEYVIEVGAEINGQVKRDHFRASYLFDQDYLHVAALSDEEQRAPYVPRGTNVLVTLPGVALLGLSRALTAKLNHDEPPSQLLGVPLLKPSYTFGLRRTPEPAQSQDVQTPLPLRIIGSTHAQLQDYSVELVAVEKSESSQAYHLRLTPLREPMRHRLRELWVDSASYAELAVISQGNFTGGPPTKARWLTVYHDVDGCRLIDREIALDSLDYGPKRQFEKTAIFFDMIDDPAVYAMPILTFRRPQREGDLVEPPD